MADTTDNILINIKIQEGGSGGASPEKAKRDTDALAGSIIGLAAANKKLREERNKLDTQDAASAKRIKELNALIDQNNQKIKDNSSALEKQRLNIGNYASALDKLIPGLGGVAAGFEGASKSAMAFLANPIVAGITVIVGAVAALGAAYAKSSQGARDLNTATGALRGTFQSVANDIGGFIESLIGEGGVTTALGAVLTSINPVIGQYFGLAAAVEKSTQAFERNKAAAEGTGKFYLELAELNKRIAEDDNKASDQRVAAANRVIELIEAGATKRRQVLEERIRDLGRIEVKSQETIDEIANLSKELSDLSEETTGRISPILQLIQSIRDAEIAANIKAIDDKAKALNDAFKKELDEYLHQDEEYKALRALDGDNYQQYLDKNKEALYDAHRAELEASQTYFDDLTILYLQAFEERQRLREQEKQEELEGREATREATINLINEGNALLDQDTANQVKKIRKAEEDKVKAIKDKVKRGVLSEEEGAKQEEAIREKANKQAESYQREQFERNKRQAIAETIINTVQGMVRAFKDYAFPYSAIVAALVGAAGTAQTVRIASQKFAQGGRADKAGTFSGPSHAQGGVKYIRSDGRHAIEVEGGENFYVLKKSASSEINKLSSLNVRHGGNSWTPSGYYPGMRTYAEGGQIVASRSENFRDINNLVIRTVEETMRNFPPIVTYVEDINAGQGIVNQITSRANPIG